MGLTLISNYTQEKTHFECYLDWTRKQGALLACEEVDTNALEASIYQKELLMKQIKELRSEAQWLKQSLISGPQEDAVRQEIHQLLVQIQPLEQENIKLAARHRSSIGRILGKMRVEHHAARGYNNVGFYPAALVFDENQ